MLILLSNDDGVGSPGLKVLADRLKELGRVVVVAPDRERSAAGHSLTLSRPLRAKRVEENWYSVDGTPTDCIALAVHGILKRRPDLMVAGINQGANLGDDVTYSGTVSAAFEATLLGIPAFAVSLATVEGCRFQTAADFSFTIAQLILEKGLPPDTLLNVNIPDLPFSEIKGVTITRQGKRLYTDIVVEKMDPRGKTYYWIAGAGPHWQAVEESDHEAVMNGWVSITPLHLDLTNYTALEVLKKWEFHLPNDDGAKRGKPAW